MSPEARRTVLRYVTRLIDYGKGSVDPEFDDLTMGQIADRIIAACHSDPCGEVAEVRARVEAAIRLVSPDDITPVAARQLRAALSGGD